MIRDAELLDEGIGAGHSFLTADYADIADDEEKTRVRRF